MIKLRSFALVVGVLACASVDNVIVAEPDTAFSLPLGKTATLGGSSTRITFKRVAHDSRCPTSVHCVWAGTADIEVTVSRDGSAPASRIFGLVGPNHEGTVGGLFVRFVALAPYPAVPGRNSELAYVAQLVVRPQ